MKFLLVPLLLALPVFAGSATYFDGGKQIARIIDDGEIRLIQIGKDGEEKLKLPRDFSKDICAVTRMPDGKLLVLSGLEARSWDPSTRKWSLIARTPAGTNFIDVALNPATGHLLFSTSHDDDSIEWMVLRKADEPLLTVIANRAPQPTHPVFDLKGNLYFSCFGDLWKGKLIMSSEEDIAENAPAFHLEASRFLPLARLESSEGNGTGVSVKEIAPMGTHLLVDLSRTNGTGWGDLVRVPNSDVIRKKQPLLMEELGPVTLGASLAVSPDGKSAFVCLDGQLYLIEGPKGAMKLLAKGK